MAIKKNSYPTDKKESAPRDMFKVWKARIDSAEKRLEDTLEDRNKSIEHYLGNIQPYGGYDKTIAVNLVYVDLKQSVSEFYSRNPKFFVDPDENDSEQAANVAELVVNKKWEERKMKKVCRNAVKETKLGGVAGFKTYYNFSKDYQPDEWDDRVVNDDVRTDFIPMDQLLKDPSAKSWLTTPWVAHKIEDRRENIMKKFDLPKNEVAITGSDSNICSGSTSSQYSTDVQADFEFGTYYEIEDRLEKEIFYIVEGCNRILNKKAKTYKYDTMYDFLMFNDIPECPDPQSDYASWRDQLIELSTYRTMECSHARRGNSKYIAKTSGKKLTEDQRNQLKTSNDATVVELDVTQDVAPFQHAALDSQLFVAENACRQDIQIISKASPRQMAGQSKTATEVKAVEMAAAQVSGEGLERLEECMASIANKWLILMAENYDGKRYVQLSGIADAEFLSLKNSLGDQLEGEPKRATLTFSGKDLQHKLKVTVKPGSTAPDNDQMRRANFQGFAQFVATAQLIAGVDQEAMLREAAQVFNVENQNLLIRKDNPLEESRLLNSGVYIAPRMDENHDYHLAIHDIETNGSSENLIHRLGHLMFKRQKEVMQQANQAVMLQNAQTQSPMGGGSFVGANMGGQMPQGAVAPQANQAPAGMAIPQPAGPPQGPMGPQMMGR